MGIDTLIGHFRDVLLQQRTDIFSINIIKLVRRTQISSLVSCKRFFVTFLDPFLEMHVPLPSNACPPILESKFNFRLKFFYSTAITFNCVFGRVCLSKIASRNSKISHGNKSYSSNDTTACFQCDTRCNLSDIINDTTNTSKGFKTKSIHVFTN